jgi:VanZ family protein
MAGGIPDAEEDRFPFIPGSSQRFIAPRIPIDGILFMLKQVGGALPREAIRHPDAPRLDDKIRSGMARRSRRHTIVRLLPAIGVIGIIFLFSSIPGESIPSLEGWLDLAAKKIGHLLIYALLAFCLARGLEGTGESYARNAWIIAVLFAITDEYHQLLVPGRGAWVVDIMIDSAGALLGIWSWRLIRSRRIRDPQ